MRHAEKLLTMEEHLLALGLRRSAFAPPFYRLVWRLGIEATPPLFASFTSLALTGGTFFALAWGACLWVSFRAAHAMAPHHFFAVPSLFIAVAAVGAGAAFGVVMAALVRYRARRLRLPPWREYEGCPKGR